VKHRHFLSFLMYDDERRRRSNAALKDNDVIVEQRRNVILKTNPITLYQHDDDDTYNNKPPPSTKTKTPSSSSSSSSSHLDGGQDFNDSVHSSLPRNIHLFSLQWWPLLLHKKKENENREYSQSTPSIDKSSSIPASSLLFASTNNNKSLLGPMKNLKSYPPIAVEEEAGSKFLHVANFLSKVIHPLAVKTLFLRIQNLELVDSGGGGEEEEGGILFNSDIDQGDDDQDDEGNKESSCALISTAISISDMFKLPSTHHYLCGVMRTTLDFITPLEQVYWSNSSSEYHRSHSSSASANHSPTSAVLMKIDQGDMVGVVLSYCHVES
jgi:hypothetical protein